MQLNDYKPAAGAKKIRKRVGRGPGSGNGKTSGRGHKGQKSRSGGNLRPGFEGGQMPLQRRLPKRGFKNIFKKDWAILNITTLNRFESGAEIDKELMIKMSLIRKKSYGLRILGNGEMEKPLTVKANYFTPEAKKKIEAAGGKALVI